MSQQPTRPAHATHPAGPPDPGAPPGPGGAASRTMYAAVLVRPRTVRLAQVPLPEPAAGQVRVKLEGCGVCASNLPPWEGRPWFEYPMAGGALGHEGWGVVDRLGEGVSDAGRGGAGSGGAGAGGVAVGDRVAMLSQHAYAEYDTAPASQVVKLPPALAGRAFPGEPLGCAVNIFKRCDVRAGDTVAVVGVGLLGALLTRLAADAGAWVLAVSRRPYSLEVARSMGAREVIEMNDHWAVMRRVGELTGDALCDRVIEATGKQWPLQLAGELVKVRGKLIVAGYHQDGERSINMQQWNWKGLDVINAHERDPAVYAAGIREAAASVAAGRFDPAALFTHRFALDQLGEALRMTRDRPEGFVKALVTMDADDRGPHPAGA